MNYFKVMGLFLTAVVVLAVGSISFTGCAGDDENNTVVPSFTDPGPPPIEVSASQLFEEYITDEAAANAKYKGKRLSFINLKVDKINSVFVDSANPSIIYPVSNSVEFRPRFTVDSAWVRQDYVVDIVGEVRGLFGMAERFLIVEDCWIKIIEGEIGVEYVDPDY
jgi:hypothetical protein